VQSGQLGVSSTSSLASPPTLRGQRLVARHADREAGQFPHIACTGKRRAAHQARKSLAEQIRLVRRQEAAAAGDFTIAVDGDDVEGIRVIELVELETVDGRQRPPEFLNEYLVPVLRK
jgi:hypothetical protein